MGFILAIAAHLKVAGSIKIKPVKGVGDYKGQLTYFDNYLSNSSIHWIRKRDNRGRDSWKVPSYYLLDIHAGWTIKLKITINSYICLKQNHQQTPTPKISPDVFFLFFNIVSNTSTHNSYCTNTYSHHRHLFCANGFHWWVYFQDTSFNQFIHRVKIPLPAGRLLVRVFRKNAENISVAIFS